MNIIHNAVCIILPYIISIIEIIGVFVITYSACSGFWKYIRNSFMKKNFDIKTNLAKGFATGLEFKMAAEILKTVIIQSLDELYVLGAVILLRAFMSLLIHFEMREEHTGKKKRMKKNKLFLKNKSENEFDNQC